MNKKLNKFVEDVRLEVDSGKGNITIDELYTKILFYQHERLIHLLVTIFTGTSTILFLLGFIAFEMIPLMLLFVITLLLFIPYILYYYSLENNIQKLYNYYFELKKKDNQS